jgi:hypothetical protein
MHIHELTPPPEVSPPEWHRQLARFVRAASDHDRIDMRVALEMRDRDTALRLLESYSDAAILERRKKKKNKKSAKRRKFSYGVYGGWFYPGYHNNSGADTSSDGADAGGGGGESIRENAESDSDIIKRFAASCGEYLGLENMPEIKLRRDPEWTRRHGTFGRYTADPHNRIELATAGRHIIDILRTLAHEMTHAAQNEQIGLPDHAGETGSEFEDGANAMAGRIMRHWAESEPELFAGMELDEDWKKAVGSAAAAACSCCRSCCLQLLLQLLLLLLLLLLLVLLLLALLLLLLLLLTALHILNASLNPGAQRGGNSRDLTLRLQAI